MLNQNLAGRNGSVWGFASGESGGKLVALKAGVDVASAGKFQFLKTFDRANSRNDLLGNLAWRFPQFLGEIECQRQCVLAQFDARGLLDDDPGQVERIGATEKVAYVVGEPALEVAVQGSPLNC
jgi:hypothetical protein